MTDDIEIRMLVADDIWWAMMTNNVYITMLVCDVTKVTINNAGHGWCYWISKTKKAQSQTMLDSIMSFFVKVIRGRAILLILSNDDAFYSSDDNNA